jgi:glycosyltransferase involved in cell wall biosynthesis
LIQDGENGLLIEPDNIPELSCAIVQVLRNDALAARLGKNGRDSVLKHFSSKVMIPRYEDFYRECVNSF